jgi:hypothetical protein
MGSIFNYHPEKGDELTIYVTELDDTIRGASNNRPPVKVKAEFKVSYTRMLSACKSPTAMKREIQEEDCGRALYAYDMVVQSVQLWMDVIHTGSPKGTYQNYNIVTIWHAVRLGQRGKLNLKLLGSWYYRWLHVLGHGHLSIYARIVPAFHFYSVKGFAELSKEQVYDKTSAMRNYAMEKACHIKTSVSQTVLNVSMTSVEKNLFVSDVKRISLALH